MGMAPGQYRTHEQIEAATHVNPTTDLYRIDQNARRGNWTDMPAWETTGQTKPIVFLARIHDFAIAAQGNGTLMALNSGDRVDLDPALRRLATLDQAVSQPTVVAVLDGRASFHLQASKSEWYGLACPYCPQPETKIVENDAQTLTLHSGIEFQAPGDWKLNATGIFYVITARSDWEITGGLRLPLFDGNQTRTFEGTSWFESLQLAPEGRLQANVAGEWGAVFLDESLDQDWLDARGAVAATGSFVLLAIGLIAKKIFAQPLNNKRRQALYNAIVQNPGIHFNQLLRLTGEKNGVAIYHLQVLRRSGLIAEQADGNRRHLFENHGRYSLTWRQVTSLRDQCQAELIAWLRLHSGATQAEILAWAQEKGWKRTTIQRRVEKLTALQIISSTRFGKSRQYNLVVDPNDLNHAAEARVESPDYSSLPQ